MLQLSAKISLVFQKLWFLSAKRFTNRRNQTNVLKSGPFGMSIKANQDPKTTFGLDKIYFQSSLTNFCLYSSNQWTLIVCNDSLRTKEKNRKSILSVRTSLILQKWSLSNWESRSKLDGGHSNEHLLTYRPEQHSTGLNLKVCSPNRQFRIEVTMLMVSKLLHWIRKKNDF